MRFDTTSEVVDDPRSKESTIQVSFDDVAISPDLFYYPVPFGKDSSENYNISLKLWPVYEPGAWAICSGVP